MILKPITIINLVQVIMLTSVTGGILVVFWMAVGKGLEKLGFIHIQFELLKLVSFFFLCPISYGVLKVYEGQRKSGELFTPTAFITSIYNAVFIVWCVGIVGFMAYMLFDIHRLHRGCRCAFPCDKDTERQFELVKKQMGMSDSSVKLVRSYLTETPYVTGFWKNTIVLPVRTYTEEELLVVLTHELTHCRQGDLRLKYFSFIVLSLHFFNPMAWILFHQIQAFSEFVCDYKACRQMGGVGKYFRILISMETEQESVSIISSYLFGRKIGIKERVRKVKEVEGIKNKSKWTVAAVLTLALVLNTVSVFSVTVAAAERYTDMYDETRNIIQVADSDVGQQVEFIPAAQVGNAVNIIAQMDEVAKAVGGIDWEIKKNQRWYTSYFKVKEGDTISVMTQASPSNVTYYIGVENAIGDQYRLTGTGNLYYPFEAVNGGYWRVFVENPSEQTISVDGSYVYKD